MSSYNRAIIVGNLGRDPEIRDFQNGGKVCNLSVATSETWKDKNTGEKRERTEWHRVAIFGEGLVGVAERYLRKGSKVLIEGRIETRKWQDQSGQDRYATEIVLRGYDAKLVMLDGPQQGGGRSGDSGGSSGGYDQSPGGAPSGGMDDEIPFAPWRIG